MINFHPNQDMLELHAKGLLPLSLSLAVSAHAEYCEHCQQALSLMTEQLSKQEFSSQAPTLNTQDVDTDDLNALLASMLNNIDELPTEQPNTPKKVAVSVKGQQYCLPRAFRQQHLGQWQGIGKVSRSRLDTGEAKARASLLHIEATGEIPEHTHKGSELTLLLAGEFSDEFNDYQPGDFMLLDDSHQHSPKTMSGCLCYTVVDAPLYFTKGISKILNPIGELIY